MKLLRFATVIGFVLCTAPIVPSSAASVRVGEGKLELPTYVLGEEDPNPPFPLLTGHSIYPYTMQDDLTDRVETIADAEDESLRDLYAGALALVLPSLEEGFGLPAVEAAAVGTPLVLSKTTAASDIFGDAALHFDPQDAAELALQIERLRDNPARLRDLALRGKAKARAMTWEKAGEVVDQAAEEVAAS